MSVPADAKWVEVCFDCRIVVVCTGSGEKISIPFDKAFYVTDIGGWDTRMRVATNNKYIGFSWGSDMKRSGYLSEIPIYVVHDSLNPPNETETLLPDCCQDNV